MQLSFAFLANFADVLRDGRLLAIGIDFDGIICPQIPMLAQVTLVVKIRVEPTEIDQSYMLGIDITRTNGKRETIIAERPFTVRTNPVNADRPSYSAIIATIGFNFESAGEHLFHVLVNGKEEKILPIDVKVEKIETQIVG